MTRKRLFATLRVASAASISVAALTGLSACEERSYSSPTHSAPPAAHASADLMGAPDQGSPYTATPTYQQPAYSSPAYSSPAYSSPYDAGSVVAMAPIPNPGDPGSGPYYGGGRYSGRIHAHYDAAEKSDDTLISRYGEGHPAPGHHPSYASTAPAPTPSAHKPPVTKPADAAPKTAAAKTTTTVTKTTTTVATQTAAPKLPPVLSDGAKSVAQKSVALAAAAGAAVGALAVDAHHAAHPAPSASAPTPVAAPAGDRAAHLASLQTALTDAVGKTAILTTPTRFTANQATDVSLTLPVGFADTLRSEAQKDGLGDAAASVNMTALLSGAGFAVTPQDTQASQLIAGQPTAFHWTVTAQPGAKGPLHADVGADLLGGGSDKLALGSVQKAADMGVKLTPHVIGAALLVLIAALVVAWLARGRGPTRSLAARRAAARRDGRPLDMTSTPVDETPAP